MAELSPRSAAAPEASPVAPPARGAARSGRYGEAVVREVLKAGFIEEVELAPRDRPVRLVEEGAPAVSEGEA